MWAARNKNDLVIEVWEKLDCESVGAAEIEAIETVVRDVYTAAAVDSPMVIARTLADEGAHLRHAEIMDLYVQRAADRPFDAALRNLAAVESLTAAERSLREMENLRQKLVSDDDREGLRRLRETAIKARADAEVTAAAAEGSNSRRQIAAEISSWYRIWLETPEVFESWLAIRRESIDFLDRFVPSRTE